MSTHWVVVVRTHGLPAFEVGPDPDNRKTARAIAKEYRDAGYHSAYVIPRHELAAARRQFIESNTVSPSINPEQTRDALDVERLARALWNVHVPFDTGMDGARKVARSIAAEYARLAEPAP